MPDRSIVPILILCYFIQVFKFLPLEGRKNVRRTCRLWNEVCNHPIITKFEKFVFRTEQEDLRRLASYIVKCRKIRAHIEFQDLQVWKLSPIVWESHGERILSLHLYDCRITDSTIRNIILCCTNLTSLCIQVPDFRYRDVNFVDSRVFCRELVLDELIERKIERRNLHTFQFFVPAHVPNDYFRKIFLIYLCIRTFGNGFWSLHSTYFERDVKYRLNGNNGNNFEGYIFPSLIENFFSNVPVFVSCLYRRYG